MISSSFFACEKYVLWSGLETKVSTEIIQSLTVERERGVVLSVSEMLIVIVSSCELSIL